MYLTSHKCNKITTLSQRKLKYPTRMSLLDEVEHSVLFRNKKATCSKADAFNWSLLALDAMNFSGISEIFQVCLCVLLSVHFVLCVCRPVEELWTCAYTGSSERISEPQRSPSVEFIIKDQTRKTETNITRRKEEREMSPETHDMESRVTVMEMGLYKSSSSHDWNNYMKHKWLLGFFHKI